MRFNVPSSGGSDLGPVRSVRGGYKAGTPRLDPGLSPSELVCGRRRLKNRAARASRGSDSDGDAHTETNHGSHRRGEEGRGGGDTARRGLTLTLFQAAATNGTRQLSTAVRSLAANNKRTKIQFKNLNTASIFHLFLFFQPDLRVNFSRVLAEVSSSRQEAKYALA